MDGGSDSERPINNEIRELTASCFCNKIFLTSEVDTVNNRQLVDCLLGRNIQNVFNIIVQKNFLHLPMNSLMSFSPVSAPSRGKFWW